ncbi:MAG: Flagellum site-determining protein YlxH [bacterium]|nr:Flagellum site-determining protein YlxH [bacterium]
MGDQLDQLRLELARRPQTGPAPTARPFRHARVLAIASGKGGVGKTNLVVNLGTTLAQQGQRVLIFDADLGLANVDVLLGIYPPHTLYHALYGQIPLNDVIYHTPNGLQILAGANGVDGLADLPDTQRQQLLQRLGYLEEQYDWLIIDCGAGIDANVLGFACTADEVLLVCTPEPTAMMDVYGLVKLIHQRGGTPALRLVMNMVDRPQEGKAAADGIKDVAQKFLQLEIPHIHYIPLDPQLRQAVRRQQPLVEVFPTSPAAKAIRSLAHALAGPGDSARPPVSFFQRVGKWLTESPRPPEPLG